MGSTSKFLSLPAEIREHIYAALLSADENFDANQTGDPSNSWQFDLNVYRTCKQIYHEADRVFRRVNTFVKVTTPWKEAVERTKLFALTPILCRGETADRFQMYQMRIEVEYMGASHVGHTFVVDARDMLGFCRMWYYFDLSTPGLNDHFGAHFHIYGPADAPERELPLSIQSRLLTPWSFVRKLKAFTVSGPHNTKLVDDVKLAMTEPYPSPTDCLERCDIAKEAGNAAFKTGAYRQALDHYVAAFEAIHIIVDGSRRSIWAENYFDLTMATGRFQGRYGGTTYLTLRIQLVANTIMIYLKLEDHQMAYYWGTRSISIMRHHYGESADEPRLAVAAANEWGKIYYRTALAAKAIGNMPEAREYVRIAAKWLPGDATVQRDCAEWGRLQLG